MFKTILYVSNIFAKYDFMFVFFQKVNTGFIENEIEKLNGESLLSLKVSEKWIDSFLLSYDFIVESIIIFIMFNIRF